MPELLLETELTSRWARGTVGHLSATVVIDERFCGPRESANGGYASAMAAQWLDGPAEVTLRTPPPLGQPLRVEENADGIASVPRPGRRRSSRELRGNGEDGRIPQVCTYDSSGPEPTRRA